MSITGIASSLINLLSPQVQDRSKQFQREFLQLGQDLQAGNLSATQADVASLQKLQPASADAASSSGAPSVSQTLQQLGRDLQTGDLKDAQQVYSNLVQQIQTHGHHPHVVVGKQVSEPVNQLQQALRGGNPSAAQQAFAMLQQDVPQFNVQLGAVDSGSSAAARSVSLRA
jgi:hypothetical protein